MIETGFSNISGGKIPGFITKGSSKPIKGIFIGAALTALLQSSSAMTVILVGAVDAGVIRLKNALYIIMGANIGTSATAWIICLFGSDDKIKPLSLYPVLGLVGVIFIILTKNINLHGSGMLLVGFMLIMSGINGMSEAVKPLNLNRIFTDFKNPLLGISAGAVTSAIAQSSSAGIGILQALSASGKINLMTAIPVILGQNIGTCLTALLASISASKNAKKAAATHLLFNVSGVIVWTIVFIIIRGILPDFAVNPMHIALIHTLFNITSAVMVYYAFLGASSIHFSPEKHSASVINKIFHFKN